jgi:outer membrane immunogenic protein
MKTIISGLAFVALMVSTNSALAQSASSSSASERLQSLGGNKDLLKKTKSLDPANRFRIVQKRAVDRTWRMELGANYGIANGGDPYVDTSAWGAFADLHISPRWSVGVRHMENRNALTAEGRRVYEEAEGRGRNADPFAPPAIDFPLSSTLGVLSFYPIYGKMNLFDQMVSQFDLYVLAGAGQVKLNSGSTATWTAGGGVGIWWTNHFSTRAEVRYQNYTDQIFSGPRDVNQVISTFSVGVML